MSPNSTTIVLPVLLITLGSGWLLTTMGVAPGIHWIWILGLAAVGLLTFVVGGFDKATVVIGSFFIAASCLSVLRQTKRMSIDIEIPVLVIVFGILLLIVRSSAIPAPRWLADPSGTSERQ